MLLVILATADCRKADPGRTGRDLLTDERTTSMFKLYYAPGTCALATHIALEEAGAPYGRFRSISVRRLREAPNTSR